MFHSEMIQFDQKRLFHGENIPATLAHTQFPFLQTVKLRSIMHVRRRTNHKSDKRTKWLAFAVHRHKREHLESLFSFVH